MRFGSMIGAVGLVAAMIGTIPGGAQAADGDLDPSFGNGGIVTTDFFPISQWGRHAVANAVIVQPNRKIVAVGSLGAGAEFGLARYNGDGSLDPMFGAGGLVVTDFGMSNQKANSAVLQPDGKIVVAGTIADTDSDAVVARYGVDGTLDPAFASGQVTEGLPGDFSAAAVALQQDGSIVVAGSFAPPGAGIFNELLAMRLLPDGTLDPTFGSGGIVTAAGGSASAVAVQPDGRIILAGSRQTSFVGCQPWDPCDMAIVLMRLNRDGSLDRSFGVAGTVTTGMPGETNSAFGLALQADGKVVAAGDRVTSTTEPLVSSDFLVVRYTADGALDTSFGGGGEVVTNFGAFDSARAVVIQPDGKIVAAGAGRASDDEAADDFAFARYDTDGSLDPSFGNGGKSLVDVDGDDRSNAIALQPDGKVVAAGLSRSELSDFTVVRLESSSQSVGPVGLVDPSTGLWYLRDAWGWIESFYYGNPGDVPFLGDWDGDGVETPGLYRQSDGYVYLRNSNTQGIADVRFFFGDPGDVPLAGDFDADGFDTVSLYRPSEARFYIINELGEDNGGLGAAEYSFLFGNPSDKPVVGDWDGDGIDEIGLHRETTGLFYYRNTLATGVADGQFYFGDPGDRFVAGDWGVVDEKDTPAVFRPFNDTFYFRWTLTQGNADSEFVWTGAGRNWLPVSGDMTLN